MKFISKIGICDVVVSDDWDTLLYGCPTVWRHVVGKNDIQEVCSRTKIIDFILELDQFKFIM